MITFDIFDIAKGNPGALTFIMEAYMKSDMYKALKAERGFQRMQDHGITGKKLYMLWNDCCNRDTDWAVDIMENESIESIVWHINYERGRGIMFEKNESAQRHIEMGVM